MRSSQSHEGERLIKRPRQATSRGADGFKVLWECRQVGIVLLGPSETVKLGRSFKKSRRSPANGRGAERKGWEWAAKRDSRL